MFPRSMPSTLIKILSASIVDLASGVEDVRPIQVMDGFFKTLWRLLKNWILMINIASAMLLQSALINLNMFQKHIYQLRFGISYLTDATDTQLATNILKQPLVAVSLIATGMVVAKNRLQVKSLVKWNIIVLIVGMGFFGSTAFLNCKPETTYYGVSSNSKCPYGCQLDQFQPVCKMATQRLYYSPCSAGCTSYNPAAKVFKRNEFIFSFSRNILDIQVHMLRWERYWRFLQQDDPVRPVLLSLSSKFSPHKCTIRTYTCNEFNHKYEMRLI